MSFRKEYPVYGRWKVTTEGDCEGRTVTQLGYWDGYVDEIALHLAEKAYYGLKFTFVDPQPKQLVPTMPEVHVQFDIESGTWDMKREHRVLEMKKLFKDRPVFIDKSNYYASFKIKSKENISQEDIEKARAKEKLIKTLSQREIDLLGIEV